MTGSGDLLLDARKNGRCIAAFNVYNMETVQAAFAAANRLGLPVMVAFGEGYLKYTSFEMIAAIATEAARRHPFPAVLHLDHCKSPEHIGQAIEAGFTSVMFDGSALGFEENIARTAQMARLAHSAGVNIEGELGYMNPEDGSEPSASHTAYTDPAQAARFAEETGVDSLAVAVGNAHGLYKGTPKLDFMRLQEIADAVSIPLVLHGCSGIPEDQLRRAIEIGVAKINVNTEIALAGSERIRSEQAASEKTVRLELLMGAAQEEMSAVMERFLRLTAR